MESHPHQSQSINQQLQSSVNTNSSPQLGMSTTFSINPRQKARDLFLRSISHKGEQQQTTFDGKSSQSMDTMQTTLGAATTSCSPFTITPVSSCSATLKSTKKFGGGGLRKLLASSSKTNVLDADDVVEQSRFFYF